MSSVENKEYYRGKSCVGQTLSSHQMSQSVLFEVKKIHQTGEKEYVGHEVSVYHSPSQDQSAGSNNELSHGAFLPINQPPVSLQPKPKPTSYLVYETHVETIHQNSSVNTNDEVKKRLETEKRLLEAKRRVYFIEYEASKLGIKTEPTSECSSMHDHHNDQQRPEKDPGPSKSVKTEATNPQSPEEASLLLDEYNTPPRNLRIKNIEGINRKLIKATTRSSSESKAQANAEVKSEKSTQTCTSNLEGPNQERSKKITMPQEIIKDERQHQQAAVAPKPLAEVPKHITEMPKSLAEMPRPIAEVPKTVSKPQSGSTPNFLYYYVNWEKYLEIFTTRMIEPELVIHNGKTRNAIVLITNPPKKDDFTLLNALFQNAIPFVQSRVQCYIQLDKQVLEKFSDHLIKVTEEKYLFDMAIKFDGDFPVHQFRFNYGTNVSSN